MRIQRLLLSDFGKFHQKEVTISKGLNLITGANESGKSTLRRFVRSMFYGLERERGIKARQDDYTRYKPWEYGRFCGSMELEIAGKNYRLWRNFLTTEKSCSMIELETGKEIERPDELLKEYGLPSEAVYVNTFWVGKDCETEDVLAKELADYLANLAYSGGANLNLQKSLTWLQARKKELERQQPERELQECMIKLQGRETLEDRIFETRKLLSEREQLIRKKEQENRRWEEDFHRLTEEKQEAEKEQRKGRSAGIILACTLCVAILCVFGMFLWQAGTILLGIAAGTSLLTGWGFALPLLRIAKKGKEKEHSILEQLFWNRASQQQSFDELLEQKVSLEKERSFLENLEEQQHALEGVQNRYEELKQVQQECGRQLRAVRLAMETLVRLSSELYEEFAGKFASALSEYARDFTDHAYERLTAEKDLTLRAVTQDRSVTVPEVSFGTGEQFYLALRFAAADVFDPEKRIPMILDDSFASFDEQRLESAILALEKSGRQILVLSSTGREEQAAKRMGLTYEKVMEWD